MQKYFSVKYNTPKDLNSNLEYTRMFSNQYKPFMMIEIL